ncbi:hypothetical protein SCATT_14780 [Streptantibioticus cattleyicolor NRRL 8057 = DSM 46488]|uniref:Uncharacterized protein n=1 Tax=Streptantibioticus cattleyicolor (strain ATCC 35852 / DSM 46488 / JCM 4925 / NBRC 14057 / NRRL 8057) TaxID=1003195 RepID=G8WZA0_STREN|nr:hypothetical protein SCATT_14780 [Streptantibioticus cattleyicolor NRRL 8057 = DSM 46488]
MTPIRCFLPGAGGLRGRPAPGRPARSGAPDGPGGPSRHVMTPGAGRGVEPAGPRGAGAVPVLAAGR